MENFGAQANYTTRLTRVTSFIYDHLDDDLELQSLADVAALSPYHWHRIYHLSMEKPSQRPSSG
jgi:AraC family transcriptional regulator